MASAHFSHQAQSSSAQSSARSRLRAQFTLEKVCEETRVSQDDLIAWEDHFGLIRSQMVEGTRRYSADTIEDVHMLRELIRSGIPFDHVSAVWNACKARTGKVISAPPSHFTEVIREIEVVLTRAAQQGIDSGGEWHTVVHEAMELVLIAFEARLAQCYLVPICGEGATIAVGDAELGSSKQFTSLAQQAMTGPHEYLRKSVPLSACSTLETLAVPLRAGESASGTLIVAWTDRKPSVEECHVALTITQQLARAVAYAQLSRNDIWHLTRVLNHIPQPAMVQDTHHNILCYNEEALELAYNRHEILDAKQKGAHPPRPRWATVLPNGDVPKDDELPSTRAVATGSLVRGVHLNLLDHPENDHSMGRPTLTSAAPLYGQGGQVQGVLVIVNDVTTALDREMRITTLTRQIAHDARGPITKTRLRAQHSIEILKKLPEHLRNDDLGKCLNEINSIVGDTRSFESMMDQVIDIKSVVKGKSERLSLVDLVRSIVNELRETHGTNRLMVEIDSAETVLAGRWVRADIVSIVTNLITNALKYSPADTLVTVKLQRKYAESAPVAQLSVIDHGFGIPQEDLTKIFEEDNRGSTPTKGRDIAGFGLGLHICRRLIQSYRYGRIWAESEGVGRGSTFNAVLPLARLSSDDL